MNPRPASFKGIHRPAVAARNFMTSYVSDNLELFMVFGIQGSIHFLNTLLGQCHDTIRVRFSPLS
jgi:hypothetical protein